MAAPLPRPNPFNTAGLFVAHSAYKVCLDMEERHDTIKQTGFLTPLICSRFLGYMVIEATTDAGRLEIATEIVRCIDNDQFQTLANLYKNHFMRCFLAAKGRTPFPSHHPSAPSFDDQKQAFLEKLVETPNDHASAKKKALIRDGYRCMLTGKLDSASVLEGLVTYTGDGLLSPTRAAHIFDRSTNQNLDDHRKQHYAASVHAVLDRFGQIHSIAELNGPTVHRLQNILTLDIGIHEHFDQLKIWLERHPDDPIHCYRPQAVQPLFLTGLGIRDRVQFTTTDPGLSLPDPRYLALHAACARVAHLSGAGEYLSSVLRKVESTRILAEDGASGDLLYHAIMCRNDIEIGA